MVNPLKRYDPDGKPDLTDAQIAEYFPNLWPSGWKQFAVNMLAELSGVFDEVGVEWLLVGGTLLGAVRHGGIIPWDDDIDISIESSWSEKLEQIVASKLTGWRIVQDYSKRDGHYFKLYKLSGELIPGKGGLRWPMIDVFIHSHKDDQVSFSTEGFDLPAAEVYPIQPMDLEGLSLPTMNDPYTNYLDPMYPEWREWYVCGDWDHRREKPLRKTLVRVPVSRFNGKKKVKFYDAAKYGSQLDRQKVRFSAWKRDGYGQRLSNRLEIDIIHDCDLKCVNCDRSCRQAPTKDGMTVEQIRRFVDESLERNYFWYIIKFTGGEATQHPKLMPMLEELEKYKKQSNRTMTWLNTNGWGDKTRAIIEEVSSRFPWLTINSSDKTTAAVKHHTAFNIAPKDFGLVAPPCHRPWDCGMGLNRYGFYPCGAGGAIDRVLGLDIGIKSLAELSHEAVLEQCLKLCPYCGYSPTDVKRWDVAEGLMSETWIEAYRKYREDGPPKLTEIYV